LSKIFVGVRFQIRLMTARSSVFAWSMLPEVKKNDYYFFVD